MPLSIFAIMDSVMTPVAPVRCGKSRPGVSSTWSRRLLESCLVKIQRLGGSSGSEKG
jgi:hypothetical protein